MLILSHIILLASLINFLLFSVKQWAQELSSHLHNQFQTATKHSEMVKVGFLGEFRC